MVRSLMSPWQSASMFNELRPGRVKDFTPTIKKPFAINHVLLGRTRSNLHFLELTECLKIGNLDRVGVETPTAVGLRALEVLSSPAVHGQNAPLWVFRSIY